MLSPCSKSLDIIKNKLSFTASSGKGLKALLLSPGRPLKALGLSWRLCLLISFPYLFLGFVHELIFYQKGQDPIKGGGRGKRGEEILEKALFGRVLRPLEAL